MTHIAQEVLVLPDPSVAASILPAVASFFKTCKTIEPTSHKSVLSELVVCFSCLYLCSYCV
jgi:hypothetical protein